MTISTQYKESIERLKGIFVTPAKDQVLPGQDVIPPVKGKRRRKDNEPTLAFSDPNGPHVILEDPPPPPKPCNHGHEIDPLESRKGQLDTPPEFECERTVVEHVAVPGVMAINKNRRDPGEKDWPAVEGLTASVFEVIDTTPMDVPPSPTMRTLTAEEAQAVIDRTDERGVEIR